MEPELIHYLDQRFGKIDRQFAKIDARFEKVDARLEENKEQIRHTHVVIEDLRSDVQGVAEGVATVNQKLDRYIESAERQRQEDRSLDLKVQSAASKRIDRLETRVGRLESSGP